MSEEKKSCDKQTAFGRQIDEMFKAIPFYRWWKYERKTQRFDPLPIAEEAWNVSEKQTRLAILTELEREIEERLSIIIYGEQSFLDTVRWEEAKAIRTLIRSKKGG